MRANLKAWRESATVIALARNNVMMDKNVKPDSYQILFQKRSSESKFFPNSIVFPGGAYESCDSSNLWIDHYKTFGITNDKFNEFQRPNISLPPILQDDVDSTRRHVALRITAIRETFEELGILICKKRNNERKSNHWAPYITDFDIIHWQNKVHEDPLQFLSLCQNLDCYPDIWSLYLWNNWLTPIKQTKRRFDTLFFLVAFENQPPVHAEKSEVSEYRWSNTDGILKSFEKQELFLPPPQWYELSRLNHYRDLSRLVTYAANRSSYGCELFFPIRQSIKDTVINILPGDCFYPSSPDYFSKMQLFPPEASVDEVNGMSETMHRQIITNEGRSIKLKCQNYVPGNFHLSPVGGDIPSLESRL